jgi:formiminoglutamase
MPENYSRNCKSSKKEKEIISAIRQQGCMDLQLYFDPIDFEQFQKEKKFNKNSLGYCIERATGNIKDGGTGKATLVMFGVPYDNKTPNKGTSKAPFEIRKHLYQLSRLEACNNIIDLGNLKSGKSDQDLYYALRDVTDYLQEAGVIAVILGGGQDISIGIARAFQSVSEFTLTIADARVDIKSQRETSDSSNFITRILRENPALFHLQMIGVQKHYIAPAVFDFLKQNTFDYLQLGTFRDEPASIEPLLRNTHFLSFDISSIKKSDAEGHFRPSPNGFYAEEACLIARYAGLSNRLMVFGLFEVNPTMDKTGITSELAAQITWYFIEGSIHRRKEDPMSDKNSFIRYYVEMEDHGEPMVFYHQPVTNRWWIEIFPEEGKSWILACKENDYKQAIGKEIPEIYWRYVRKTTRLSK